MSKQRTIKFKPAYDCIAVQPCVHGSDDCKPGTGGSHGRHSVDMRWILSGPEGAVQFLVFTGWMLDATPESAWGHTMAVDLGYHSPTPRYEGQSQMSGDCEWVQGGKCYYDGGGLAADKPWRLLREQGDEAVWEFLEGYYADTFQVAQVAS